MHELIRGLLLAKLNNPILARLGDSAVVYARGNISFTTDSFVVKPLSFPGGDIGKLAVCGAVNDLVMAGARPRWLSLAFILEEGLPFETLEAVVDSIAAWSRRARVCVVTGDIKVVEKGACDKLFVTVSGVGEVVSRTPLSVERIRPGDKIIVTGDIGRHGLAVIMCREGFRGAHVIESDCAALDGLLLGLVRSSGAVRCMRDPTRGGIATTLNEFAGESGFGIRIDERAIPLSPKVRAASELLGLDPLYSANEGRALVVVSPSAAGHIVSQLHKHPLGRKAAQIGTVVSSPRKRVVLVTVLGTERVLPMLALEQLPRIC